MTDPAPPAPIYDPAADYAVILSRLVRIDGLKLLPRAQNTLTGAAILRVIEEYGADAIDSAAPLSR